MEVATQDASIRAIAAAVIDRVTSRSVIQFAEGVEDGILVEAAVQVGITEPQLDDMSVVDVKDNKVLVDAYNLMLERFLENVSNPGFGSWSGWKQVNGTRKSTRSQGNQMSGVQFARAVIKWKSKGGKKGSKASTARASARAAPRPAAVAAMVQPKGARPPVAAVTPTSVPGPTIPRLPSSGMPAGRPQAAAVDLAAVKQLQQQLYSDTQVVGTSGGDGLVPPPLAGAPGLPAQPSPAATSTDEVEKARAQARAQRDATAAATDDIGDFEFDGLDLDDDGGLGFLDDLDLDDLGT